MPGQSASADLVYNRAASGHMGVNVGPWGKGRSSKEMLWTMFCLNLEGQAFMLMSVWQILAEQTWLQYCMRSGLRNITRS